MRITRLAIALLFALLLCQTAYASDPIRISMPTWVGNGPLFLAQELGYYEEEGVDVELSIMDDISMRFAAYYGGQLDGMSTALAAYILNAKEKMVSSVVLMLDDSRGGDGIVSNKDITSITGLKGKKVAYKQGSVSEWYFTHLLLENGMTPADVQQVNMEPGAAGTAFIAGKVDAAVTWEPYLTKGKQAEHGHLLTDSSAQPGLISDVLIFPNKVIEERSADIQKVCNAVVRAVEYWEKNPEEANKIMAEAIGGWLKDPAAFADTLTGIKYYTREMNKKAFAEGQVRKMVEDRIDVWKKLGKLDWEPNSMDMYNAKFAENL